MTIRWQVGLLQNLLVDDMPDRPEVHPDFAMDDVLDPVSGQPNVVQPSAPKQGTGWSRYEKPPRQYMNWLHRTTAQWIRWLEGKADQIVSATSAPTPDTLMERDEDGRAQVTDPVEDQDIATLGYVRSAMRRTFTGATPFGGSLAPADPDPTTVCKFASFGPQFIAFYDSSNDFMQYKRLADGQWFDLGNAIFMASYTPIRSLMGMNPEATVNSARMAALVTMSGDIALAMFSYANPNWTLTGSTLALPSVSENATAFALSPDTVAVLDPTGGTIQAYTFDGSVWSPTGAAGGLFPEIGGVTWHGAALRENQAVLHARPASETVPGYSVWEFDGAVWTQTGPMLASGLGSNNLRLVPLSESDFVVLLETSTHLMQGFRVAAGTVERAGYPRFQPGGVTNLTDAQAINGTTLLSYYAYDDAARLFSVEYSVLSDPYRPA